MRKAIDQYSGDKGKYPQSLEDLVSERYLREIPLDPISERDEWDQVFSDDPLSPDAGQGLSDVKSLATGTDADGKAYSEY